MDLGVTDKVKPLIDKVRQMVSDDIEPLDQEFHEEVGKHPSGSRWQFTERQMEILTHLKSLAKERGLWNFWLTDSEKGYGLSTVEYDYLAEEMGKVGDLRDVPALDRAVRRLRSCLVAAECVHSRTQLRRVSEDMSRPARRRRPATHIHARPSRQRGHMRWRRRRRRKDGV